MSQAGINNGVPEKLRLNKKVLPVRNCRNISKKDMKLNETMPKIDVNPETYEVSADGQVLRCEPSSVLPMAQRYFLF
jgi:urease subunit alpha